MITIKEGSLLITVPEQWSEVTIQNQIVYEQLHSTIKEFTELIPVAAYCGLDFEDVKRLPFSTNIRIITILNGFLHKEIPKVIVTDFEFQGESYNVVESLLKSETQDFISLESTLANYQNKLVQALPHLVAIIAKRKIKKSINDTIASGVEYESLSDINLDERSKLFLSLPITIASGIQSFFFTSAHLYTTDFTKVLKEMDQGLRESISYLESTIEKHNGGGLSMKLQKKTLLSILKLIKSHWEHSSTGII